MMEEYMTEYRPMQQLPEAAGYGAGDVLVLVGELFGRGYANGLVDEARRLGMSVIGTTVGRRDADGTLRPLNAEELSDSEALLGGKIINVPLEAGFDMEPAAGQPSVAEQLKKARPDDLNTIAFDDDFILQTRAAGTARFRSAISQVSSALETLIPPGANVVFAHSMAGGIPRARVFMPLLNRVFKSTGEKYLPSGDFWNSGLGRLCDASFNEVTADTFRYLVEETAALRSRISGGGGQVRYTAYGYHGTAVLVGGEFRWQSYTPYVQGIAKMRLEDIAADVSQQGIVATVFNCPEIQTNSSALFLGVEISLYPLLTAIRREVGDAASAPLFERCQLMLKEGETVDNLLTRTDSYLASPILSEIIDYDSWPQPNTLAQAELMLASSAELMGMHTDQKQLICAELSRIVFQSTGRLMLHGSWNPAAPTLWLNHDIIARLLSDSRGRDILDV
jgi:hypothetical protein